MTVQERFKRIYERFALALYFKQKNFRTRKMDGSVKEVAYALKKEAGHSGSLRTINGVGFRINNSPKGLELGVGSCKPQNGGFLRTYEFGYTWHQVAKMVLERGLTDEAR